jgi:hypothetical protein
MTHMVFAYSVVLKANVEASLRVTWHVGVDMTSLEFEKFYIYEMKAAVNKQGIKSCRFSVVFRYRQLWWFSEE